MTTTKADSGAIADAMIATWPEVIYLVNGCDETPDYKEVMHSGEVTWCVDKQAVGDVQYVSAELYFQLRAKLAAAEARANTSDEWRERLHALNEELAGRQLDAEDQAEARTLKAVEAMPVDEPIKCWSFNEEEFNYESLGDLIDSNADELKAGQTVWFADAVKPAASRLVDADDVMTMMRERADDIAGEYAEGYPDVDKEAVAELDALLVAWVAKHAPLTFYEVENVKPYVLTAEDLGDATASESGAA